ncbi:MAG: NAD(P)-dependent oxidoreductase [Alphaproteobacteria bacterium]|jgi:phosphoglycerate dehydrogenase-like enzyme|nr:NAD(P)-dependent oxidoreductase [Alphaproteobacteria bacterium]
MPVTVAIYDKALELIGERLEALALDIIIHPFNKDGWISANGGAGAPGETGIDYFWLSPSIAFDRCLPAAFELVLGCKSVGVLQTFNAGLDLPQYKKISGKGIRICNSSAQAVSISEYVLAHVLSLLHPIEQQRDQQANKLWKSTPFREISRMNWLIIGFGPVGQEVAKRVKSFGATTAVVRRSPETSDIVDKAGKLDDLETYLPEADVVVLACSLNDDTRDFADAGFFAALKEGAILVNVARGALIVDAAMLAALDEGRLAAAVLDVFRQEPLPEGDPLWSHPKVRVTSHTSSSGNGSFLRWEQLFLDNIVRYVRGDALENEVNPKDIV